MPESVVDTPEAETRETGVYQSSWGNAWFVQIRHGGRLYYRGSFRTIEEANEVSRTTRAKLRGTHHG